jgi:hypothetical protein
MSAGGYFLLGCAIGVVVIIYKEIEAYKVRKRTGEPAPKQEKPPKKQHSRGETFMLFLGVKMLADRFFDKD